MFYASVQNRGLLYQINRFGRPTYQDYQCSCTKCLLAYMLISMSPFYVQDLDLPHKNKQDVPSKLCSKLLLQGVLV